MATYLYIGQKGSGKSATLTQIIHDHLYRMLVSKIDNRIIVTDVAIRFQKLRREFLERYGVDIEGRIFCRKKGFQHTKWLRKFYHDRGPDKLLFEEYVADDTGYRAVRVKAPPRTGVVYVLDEIIAGWRARDTMRSWGPEVEYYMEFEDQLGDDTHMATQHEELCDVNLLRLVNYVIRLVNTEQRMLFGFRIPGWMAGGRFLSRWYSEASPGAVLQRVEPRRFVSWLANCYNTDSVRGMHAERHKVKIGRDWKWAVIPAVIGFALLASAPFAVPRLVSGYFKRSTGQDKMKLAPRIEQIISKAPPLPPPSVLSAVQPLARVRRSSTTVETMPSPVPAVQPLTREVVINSSVAEAPAIFPVSAMRLGGLYTRVRWSDGSTSLDRGVWDGWVYTTESGLIFNPPQYVGSLVKRSSAVKSTPMATPLSPLQEQQKQLEFQRTAFRNLSSSLHLPQPDQKK